MFSPFRASPSWRVVRSGPSRLRSSATLPPFLKKHCVVCHGAEKPKGGVRFDGPAPDFTDAKVAEKWLMARRLLAQGEMPPEGKLRPTADELLAADGRVFVSYFVPSGDVVDAAEQQKRDKGPVNLDDRRHGLSAGVGMRVGFGEVEQFAQLLIRELARDRVLRSLDELLLLVVDLSHPLAGLTKIPRK